MLTIRQYFTKRNFSPLRESKRNSYPMENTKLLEQDVGKPSSKTMNKIQKWFSKESLKDVDTDSGIAYRRHPEDVRQMFGRPKSTGTSVACYGSYMSLDILDIRASQESLLSIDAKRELSQSLVSLERIESIQQKSLDVTRHRRKNIKNKENKKRRRDSANDDKLRGCKIVIEVELPMTDEDDLDPARSETRIQALRKSSIQRKSWEIRRQRKMIMKKRRSDHFPDVAPIFETLIY